MTNDEKTNQALESIANAQAELTIARKYLESTLTQVITDRVPRHIPELVPISVGEVILDPIFGSKILRLTGPGSAGLSYRSSDSTPQRSWNSKSQRLVVESTQGEQLLYEFGDMRADFRVTLPFSSRRKSKLNLENHLRLPFNGSDCSFHDTNPDEVYGRWGNKIIKVYNIQTLAFDTVIDLDTLGLDLPEESYTGSVLVQNDTLATVCGGAVNDYNHFIVVKPLSGGPELTLDTLSLEPYHPGGIYVHAIMLDLTANYLLIIPSMLSNDPGHLYSWNLRTDEVTQVSTATSGHLAPGKEMWVNQDCKEGTSWDAAQWTRRSFLYPDRVENCIGPVLEPKEIYLAEHPSWTNMQSREDPFVSATYRYQNTDVPWRAWDEEVITVYPMTGEVKRHCHHRSMVLKGDVWDYWATPRPNISPNGKYAVFTSNWGRTLWTDSAEGGDRQDAFIVELR